MSRAALRLRPLPATVWQVQCCNSKRRRCACSDPCLRDTPTAQQLLLISRSATGFHSAQPRMQAQWSKPAAAFQGSPVLPQVVGPRSSSSVHEPPPAVLPVDGGATWGNVPLGEDGVWPWPWRFAAYALRSTRSIEIDRQHHEVERADGRRRRDALVRCRSSSVHARTTNSIACVDDETVLVRTSTSSKCTNHLSEDVHRSHVNQFVMH